MVVWAVGMYIYKLVGCMFSLWDDLYAFLSKLNATSRKSTVYKLHCMVIEKPHP